MHSKTVITKSFKDGKVVTTYTFPHDEEYKQHEMMNIAASQGPFPDFNKIRNDILKLKKG